MTPDANDLCVFAIKRGNIEKRLDINYNLPQYAQLVSALRAKFGNKLKRIGDIADVICGPFGSAIKTSDYQETGIPLVRITNISKDGYMDYSDIIYISEELGNSLSRTQVSKGDIVISQRGSLGQCAVVDDKFPVQNISANIIAVKSIKEVSAQFIHDYLLSTIGQKLLERSTSGQVQQKITTQDISDILIPTNCNEVALSAMLSLAYQSYKDKLHTLVTDYVYLSKYIHNATSIQSDDAEYQTVFAIRLADAMNERIDSEYHNPFYTLRTREIKKANHDLLGNIIEFSNEIWNQNDYFDSSFPYIEISNVHLKENEYEVSDVLLGEAPSRAKMIVRNGDIIVSTTRPQRGAIATIKCKENEIQIASTGFCVLRNMKRPDVLKEYLQWILLDDYVLLQMLQRSSGGNYPAISAEELKKIIIPIPDIDIQKQICDEANKRIMKAKQLRMEAEKEWAKAKAQFEKELLGEA